MGAATKLAGAMAGVGPISGPTELGVDENGDIDWGTWGTRLALGTLLSFGGYKLYRTGALSRFMQGFINPQSYLGPNTPMGLKLTAADKAHIHKSFHASRTQTLAAIQHLKNQLQNIQDPAARLVNQEAQKLLKAAVDQIPAFPSTMVNTATGVAPHVKAQLDNTGTMAPPPVAADLTAALNAPDPVAAKAVLLSNIAEQQTVAKDTIRSMKSEANKGKLYEQVANDIADIYMKIGGSVDNPSAILSRLQEAGDKMLHDVMPIVSAGKLLQSNMRDELQSLLQKGLTTPEDQLRFTNIMTNSYVVSQELGNLGTQFGMALRREGTDVPKAFSNKVAQSVSQAMKDPDTSALFQRMIAANPMAFAKMVGDIPEGLSLTKELVNFFYVYTLSGINTMSKVFVGNTRRLGQQLFTDALEASIGAVRNRTMEPIKDLGASWLYGVTNAIGDAFGMAIDAWRTGDAQYTNPTAATQLSSTRSKLAMQAFHSDPITSALAHINYYGSFISGRVLLAGDEATAATWTRMRLYQEALKRSKGSADPARFVKDYMANPPKEVMAQLVDHARRMNLSRDLDGGLQKLQSFAEGPISRFLLGPFVRSKVNQIRDTMLMIPGVNLLFDETKALAANPATRDRYWAETGTGAIMMVMGAMAIDHLVQEGYMVPPVMDKKQANIARRNGVYPGDILLGDGRKVTLQTETWSQLMSLGYQLSRVLNTATTSGDGNLMERAGQAALATGMALTVGDGRISSVFEDIFDLMDLAKQFSDKGSNTEAAYDFVKNLVARKTGGSGVTRNAMYFGLVDPARLHAATSIVGAVLQGMTRDPGNGHRKRNVYGDIVSKPVDATSLALEMTVGNVGPTSVDDPLYAKASAFGIDLDARVENLRAYLGNPVTDAQYGKAAKAMGAYIRNERRYKKLMDPNTSKLDFERILDNAVATGIGVLIKEHGSTKAKYDSEKRKKAQAKRNEQKAVAGTIGPSGTISAIMSDRIP